MMTASQVRTPQVRTPSEHSVTRRTIAKGLAWTAPVITFAPAAHAYSSSAPSITVIGGATKLPGNSCCAQWSGSGPCPYYKQSYRYYFTAINPPGKDACLVVTAVRLGVTVTAGVADPTSGINAVDYQIFTSSPTPTVSGGCACASNAGQSLDRSILIPAGCTTLFAIDADSQNSANSNMYFTYSIYNGSSGTPDNSFVNNCAAPVVSGTPDCTLDFAMSGQAVGTPVDGNCNPY